MKRISALLFGWCVSTAAAANAQNGWRPRAVTLSSEMTSANRAAAIAHLEAIERIFRQVPELAHPDGFEIQPVFTGGGRLSLGQDEAVQRGYVREYRLMLYFLLPGQLQSSGDITVTVNRAINDIKGWHDDQGRELYAEPWRVDRVPFAIQAYGGSNTGRESTGLSPTEASYVSFWFTSGGELPWRPVTREEYFKAQFFETEGKNGEKLAELKKLAEKSPYQRWLDEAPKRKQEREEVLSTLARLQSPAEVAKLRKVMEDAERDAGEQFKKSENSDRDDSKKPVESIESLHAELNRMTPAQRKLPTILDYNSDAYRATGVYLRDRDTVAQGISRVLTPNYDFWRARRSPVEVRDIEAHISAILGCCSPPPPPVHNALWQTYKKLDWRALAALLDQPTRP